MKNKRGRQRAGLIIAGLIILATGFQYWVYPRLAIMSGYSAKLMCSCRFVSGLPQETIRKIDLGFTPLSWASVIVNEEDSTVKANVLGMQPQKAVYRPGMGCALVHDLDAKAVDKPNPRKFSDNNSWHWPRASADKRIPHKLDTLLNWAFTSPAPNHAFNTRAVVVIKDGQLIAERYAPGITAETPLLGWSMTKSLTATHWAVKARQSDLQLQQSPFSAPLKSTPTKITWKDFLQMQSGVKWEEDYASVSDATKMLFESDSMGAYAAQQPLEFKPGRHWEYSSGTTNLLSFLLSKQYPSAVAYRKSLYNDLLKPIGANSFLVETDAAGFFVGSSYGFATARDWAKLGQLYLNKGVWEGDTLFDKSFVEFATTPAADSKKQYGGQFWLNAGEKLPDLPADCFFMDGFHGQRLFIAPSENLVVVRLGVTYNPDWIDFNHLFGGIYRALENSSFEE